MKEYKQIECAYNVVEDRINELAEDRWEVITAYEINSIVYIIMERSKRSGARLA